MCSFSSFSFLPLFFFRDLLSFVFACFFPSSFHLVSRHAESLSAVSSTFNLTLLLFSSRRDLVGTSGRKDAEVLIGLGGAQCGHHRSRAQQVCENLTSFVVCVCVINFNLCGTEAVSVKLLFEISMLEAIASRKCYL